MPLTGECTWAFFSTSKTHLALTPTLVVFTPRNERVSVLIKWEKIVSARLTASEDACNGCVACEINITQAQSTCAFHPRRLFIASLMRSYQAGLCSRIIGTFRHTIRMARTLASRYRRCDDSILSKYNEREIFSILEDQLSYRGSRWSRTFSRIGC